MCDKGLRVSDHTYRLVFFFKLFAALFFLRLFKVFFELLTLFCALIRKVGFARSTTHRTLELYRLPFQIKRKLFLKDLVAF